MRAAMLSGLMVLALPAGAQEAERPAPAASGEELKVEDGAFVIEGKVQKPQVVVVIRRETLDEGIDLDLRDNFLEKIHKATEEAPF